ncbi:MAG: hypothetical protein ACO2O0_06645 [Desulfurococcales archaeon]|jgi:hypothetical protein
MTSPPSVSPLSSKSWFSGVYEKIYDIVAMGGRLPPPNEIVIIDKPPEEFPDAVVASVNLDNKLIWFKYEPPHPFIYAHELAHLAIRSINKINIENKEDIVLLEEVYADNIARLVLMFVNRNIKPLTNPARLFEEIRLRDIANAMRERFGFSGSDREVILQYYKVKGILPLFVDIEHGDMKADNIPDHLIALLTLILLIDDASLIESPSKLESAELEVILDLLNKLADEGDDLIEGWDEEEKIWEEIEDEENSIFR